MSLWSRCQGSPAWIGSRQRAQVALPALTRGAIAARRCWWWWPQLPLLVAQAVCADDGPRQRATPEWLGRMYGLVQSMPANEAARIAGVSQRLEASLERLEK